MQQAVGNLMQLNKADKTCSMQFLLHHIIFQTLLQICKSNLNKMCVHVHLAAVTFYHLYLIDII